MSFRHSQMLSTWNLSGLNDLAKRANVQLRHRRRHQHICHEVAICYQQLEQMCYRYTSIQTAKLDIRTDLDVL